MIPFVICMLILSLLFAIARWIATAPLMRAMSASIDGWAESMHGNDGADLV